MKMMLAYASLLACSLMLAFVAYVNYDAIVGAFGDGPPYYGQSTNMDKWKNPLPTLIALDALAFVIAWIALRWSVKALR